MAPDDQDKPTSQQTPYWKGALDHRQYLLRRFIALAAIMAGLIVLLVVACQQGQ